MDNARRHITLTELQGQIKGTLEGAFPLPVWVAAEISEIKVNYSGHCYIELVEKGGDNGVPKAQARAVIWKSNYPMIQSYFGAETGRTLASGIKILAKATVSYHEIYGLSLRITDIDAAYTLGEIAMQRLATIEKLRTDGVWDMNREIAAPQLIQRIAVISSRNAAGYQDFCNELAKSPYRFALTLFDAFMQGGEAENSILSALYAAAESSEKFDAAVIIRGGGSVGDLNCFNSYGLCAAIAQFPMPVITGIGHDKDVSVADMVANMALKTPTAVAGWLVDRMAQADALLEYAAMQLQSAATEITRREEIKLERIVGEIRSLSRIFLDRRTTEIGGVVPKLADATEHLTEKAGSWLDAAEELIAGRSPDRILKLGFSIVRISGKAVITANRVSEGDSLEIEVADGKIETTVKKVEIWQKKR